LNSIKTIKFAAWEDKFYDRMQNSRDHELNVLKTRFNIRVLANVVTQITPPLVTVVTFAFYTLYFKQPLTAATAFTSLSLFSMIRTPLAAILEMITAATNAFVSAARVEDFLGVEETLKYDQLSVATKPEEPTIGFVKAVIKHAGKDDEKIKIHDMASGGNTGEDFRLHLDDISFPVGKMSIIVGSVGSGKTALLNSLLGETTLLDGKIFMVNDQGDRELCEEDLATGLTDTIAYCPQAPWLIGATIRENILFGRAYDEKRYSEVIAACALERDLEIWEDKDRTLVGEKGTVCSGGQKSVGSCLNNRSRPNPTSFLELVLRLPERYIVLLVLFCAMT
jgi:ABC-type multidrug transport system fused ATPase/permease subunit